MSYLSPSHMWADRAGLPDSLGFVAAAAVAATAALAELRSGRIDLAARLWASVNGDELLRLWNVPVAMPERESRRPAPADVLEGAPAVSHSRPSRATSREVFERDGFRCAYCSIPVVTQWKGGDIVQLVEQFPHVTPSLTVKDGQLHGGGKGGALLNADTASGSGTSRWLIT